MNVEGQFAHNTLDTWIQMIIAFCLGMWVHKGDLGMKASSPQPSAGLWCTAWFHILGQVNPALQSAIKQTLKTHPVWDIFSWAKGVLRHHLAGRCWRHNVDAGGPSQNCLVCGSGFSHGEQYSYSKWYGYLDSCAMETIQFLRSISMSSNKIRCTWNFQQVNITL